MLSDCIYLNHRDRIYVKKFGRNVYERRNPMRFFKSKKTMITLPLNNMRKTEDSDSSSEKKHQNSPKNLK